ncbi:unnamed protein product [Ixodes persulcatus]
MFFTGHALCCRTIAEHIVFTALHLRINLLLQLTIFGVVLQNELLQLTSKHLPPLLRPTLNCKISRSTLFSAKDEICSWWGSVHCECWQAQTHVPLLEKTWLTN